MNVHIYDSKIMIHILSNLPEAYKNNVEILEDYLNDDYNPLTIKRIHSKLLVNYNQIIEQWEKNTKRRFKNLYAKSQYKGTCMCCRK